MQTEMDKARIQRGALELKFKLKKPGDIMLLLTKQWVGCRMQEAANHCPK
jgi:hypothetical protein